VLEYRVLKRTFGLRREKQQEAGENEHHDVSLPSVSRMIKSRRMGGGGGGGGCWCCGGEGKIIRGVSVN